MPFHVVQLEATLPDHTSLFKTFSNGPLARTDLEALYDGSRPTPPILSCSTGRTRSHRTGARLARLRPRRRLHVCSVPAIELMDGLLYLAIESVASAMEGVSLRREMPRCWCSRRSHGRL